MTPIKDFIETTIGIDIFNLYGSFASIIGLIITIFIFVKVNKIHREYLSRIRIPDIIRNIKTRYKDISKYMNNIDSSINEIKRELAICNAYLKSLKHKAPKLRKNVRSLSKKIHRLVSPNFFNEITDKFIIKADSDVVIDIHNQLGALIAEIEDYMKDQPWRIKP